MLAHANAHAHAHAHAHTCKHVHVYFQSLTYGFLYAILNTSNESLYHFNFSGIYFAFQNKLMCIDQN